MEIQPAKERAPAPEPVELAELDDPADRQAPCLGSGDEIASTSEEGDRSSYAVGYKRPPFHSRFKPGQSGNPRGKPKKARSLHTIVRENLTEKVSVRTATGEKKITRIEAVLHKTVEQAMKGNPRALAELIKLYGNAVPEEKHEGQRQERDEDLTATDLASLAELRGFFESEKDQGR